MIKRLLFLLLFISSLQGFSQATANQAPNLRQCGDEVFDLTQQNVIILGAQTPPQFTIDYFTTLADAEANVNAIANPAAYISPEFTIIYARVTNTSDATYATTSFQVLWEEIFQVSDDPDVIACNNYVLLPTFGVNYTADEAGTIPAPGNITSTMTVYKHLFDFPCGIPSSFLVTINHSPTITPHPNVIACDAYVPETLSVGTYHSAPGGAPETIIPASQVITESMTVYIFAETGTTPNCTAESSFTVTIIDSPTVYPMPDVQVCDVYILQPLQYGNYFTEPNGSGTMLNAGDAITTNMTIYVFAATGNCTAQTSFNVFISPMPYYPMNNVTACNSFTLPELPFGYNYYTGEFGSGSFVQAGTDITETTLMHIFGQFGICVGDSAFMITIGNPPVVNPTLLIGCDGNSDGFASFNLNERIQQIVGNVSGLQVTFHETMIDAQTATAAIISPYMNITPFSQIVYARVESIAEGCFTIVNLQLTTQVCGTISGTVRIDTDNNGCTASDGVATNMPLWYYNSSGYHYAYTNNLGQYTFTDVYPGSTSVIVQTGAGNTSTPTSHTFSVLASGNYTGDFCINSVASIYDARIYVSSSTAARPGFAAGYNVIVRNEGNIALNGTATLTFDNSKLDFVLASPAAISQTANTLTFDVINLLPSQYVIYNVAFTVKAPPTANAGEFLNFNAAVTIPQTDATPANNTLNYSQELVNSLDPNDITVLQGAFIYQENVQDDLIYTVRFQNTGSANAVNVRIENKLDSYLDWSTFRPVAASHNYVAERNGNEVIFRFNNINLPAVSANEQASHGYVIYSVRPNWPLAVGSIISAHADIYFDFNAPITTNTVTTELIENLGVGENTFGYLRIYPNPASGSVVIHLADSIDGALISLHNIQGKLILTHSAEMVGNETTLDVSKVQSGLYFITVEANGRSVTKKLMVK